jgi:hypothetical protein
MAFPASVMCGDCVSGSSIGVEVEGGECDFTFTSVSKIHAVYKAEHESPET